MSIQSKIRENVQPQLEAGETFQSGFPAQSGISPWLMIGTGLLLIWKATFVNVAVTDRRILVYKRGAFKAAEMKELIGTFPRETSFGKQSGIFGTVELGGKKYWVHKKFRKDIEAADAAREPATAAAAS
jgi:hypothetical protein